MRAGEGPREAAGVGAPGGRAKRKRGRDSGEDASRVVAAPGGSTGAERGGEAGGNAGAPRERSGGRGRGGDNGGVGGGRGISFGFGSGKGGYGAPASDSSGGEVRGLDGSTKFRSREDRGGNFGGGEGRSGAPTGKGRRKKKNKSGVFIGQSVTPGNVQTSEQAASKRSDNTGSAPDGAPRKRKKK